MTLHYADESVQVFHGDCLDVLRTLPDCSVDAVVTDPPAGISFMSKGWDGNKGGREQWSAWLADVMREALRVTKPGGHALVWALPRTSHWTACGLEDAGWEIRDKIVHLFGSGFPKSLDVSRAIDRAVGAERQVVGRSNTLRPRASVADAGTTYGRRDDGGETWDYKPITAPATLAAQQWSGWGTALKPAAEDWWLCRKPLAAGTVAANVLAHGVGALNVDGCRVATGEDTGRRPAVQAQGSTYNYDGMALGGNGSPLGRWPTNVVLDEAAAAALDRDSGTTRSPSGPVTQGGSKGNVKWFGDDNSGEPRGTFGVGYGDSGGASRYFPVFKYEAKAPAEERPRVDGVGHPTVKPVDLMRWLVRLVTPPGGTVLEPFAGSGTTAEACVIEGVHCIAIEREAAYLPLIVARLSKPIQPDLFGGVA